MVTEISKENTMAKKVIVEVCAENPHAYGFLAEKNGRKFLGSEIGATRYSREDAAQVEQSLREFLGPERPVKIRIMDDPYDDENRLIGLGGY